MAYEKDTEVHIEDDDARAASTPGILRWILGISLLLAIVALSGIWIFGALTQGSVETEGTATGRIEEMRSDGADAAGMATGADEGIEEPEPVIEEEGPIETPAAAPTP
jgi:hypothetical protein